MGKQRGKRRTVLQLSDNKDSFLARYGYGRQNDEDEDSRGAFVEGGYDEGDDQPTDEELDEGPSVKEGASVSQVNGGKTDIDDKVADFLAEIDALPAPDDDEDENEEEARPSFKVEIPPPSFKLNSNPQTSNDQEDAPVRSFKNKKEEAARESESRSKYKSMFVKGASEFMSKKENTEAATKESREEEWPEEPVSVWQQTLDDHTQCFYYWNTISNEVTWEIPAEFTQYLLLRKEYDEKVDRLTKEGRVKPTKPKQDNPDSVSSAKSGLFGPELPSGGASSVEGGDNSGVSSTSSILAQKKSGGILKNADHQASSKPDSTKSSKASLVDATYFDNSEDDSSSSEYESDDAKKTKKKKEESDSAEVDMDLDDIDAALDMALDNKDTKKPEPKKTSKEEPKTSVVEKKKENVGLKQRSLVEEMKEQVQKRQEMEARNAARRKAAIEEMMARELERRVGPPRKRSSEDDLPQTVWDSKRSKSSDSRRRDHDHGSHRSSSERDHDRDSKRKHDDRKDKKKKKDDRHSKDRDEKRKDKDKDREERKKDKHRDRDEKKKDKDGKKDKEKSKESKKEEKKEEKKEKKEAEVVEEVKEKEVVQEEKEIVEKAPVVEELPPETEKFLEKAMVKSEDRMKEVQLANLKMQASELADLALSKLEFLEVTKKGLSKLQILLIELETRHQDWQAGGLNTEFFVAKLEEANWQLQQYEQSAAPPGWTCHWDRAYRRYFYMGKKSKRTQWDYPDDEDEEEEENDESSNAMVEKDSSEKFVPKPPERHPDGELSRSPESHSVTSASSEPTSLSSSMRDIDLVTSTTVVSGGSRPEVGALADTTVSSKSAVISSSILRQSETTSKETVQENQSGHAEEGGQQRGFNYLSNNEMGIYRGEPPPPGTDLELLLTAPPPPPPPDDQRQEYRGLSDDDEEEPDQGRRDVQNGDSDMDVDSNEALPSSVQTYSPQSDGALSFSQASRLGEQMFSQNMEQPSTIITRGPQIFSSDAVMPPTQGMGDGYYPASSIGDIVESSGSFAAAASSTQDFVEGSADSLSTGHPSSPYPVDKEKKKKKKDKTMSSTSLNLKKKNVSSMVLKWQKVKKEVEIEERNREEREMAIRQQLEELKQEYS